MDKLDFFISDKWNRYSKEAKILHNIAQARGFTVWIDVEHPFQCADKTTADSDSALDSISGRQCCRANRCCFSRHTLL